MFSVNRLPGALGAGITGIDLAATLECADERTLSRLFEVFFEHQVIAVRDQSLTPAQFAAFARRFGRPQPHILSHLRLPEQPEILPLSNVFRDGKPIGVYDGAAYWHTDMSYEEEPSSATIVYALQTPAAGGETRFADMYGAYDSLPDRMKQRIDGLTVLHHYGNRDDLEENSRTSASPLTDEQKAGVVNVFHPLVRRHPMTGRKALYGVSGSSFGIVGMPDGEAIALLDELKAHATQPQFIYSHRYRVGDVIAWDNASLLHSATLIPPATGPEDTRLLYRISVKGWPAGPEHSLSEKATATS